MLDLPCAIFETESSSDQASNCRSTSGARLRGSSLTDDAGMDDCLFILLSPEAARRNDQSLYGTDTQPGPAGMALSQPGRLPKIVKSRSRQTPLTIFRRDLFHFSTRLAKPLPAAGGKSLRADRSLLWGYPAGERVAPHLRQRWLETRATLRDTAGRASHRLESRGLSCTTRRCDRRPDRRAIHPRCEYRQAAERRGLGECRGA